MSDDVGGFVIGMFVGALLCWVIAPAFSNPPKDDSPAKAWENYVEMRELADQQYKEAYGLEAPQGKQQ